MEEEELAYFPSMATIEMRSQSIIDFAQSWDKPLDICAIMVLKQVSLTRAKYIQKTNPILFQKYASHFYFFMGTRDIPPPPPQPKDWLPACFKTQIPFQGWMPSDFKERWMAQNMCNKLGGFKHIKDCMPPLREVIAMNKDFLEGKKPKKYYQ